MKTEDTNNTANIGEGMDELDQLRAQISVLRDELAQSRIVNQRIIRQAMRDRSSWLNTFVKLEAISIPFFGLLFIGVSSLVGASIWPGIVFMLVAVVSTWADTRTFGITTKSILTLPMLQLKERLKAQKRERFIQLVIEVPLTILWLVWFGSSLQSSLQLDHPIMEYVNTGGIVGLIVGLIVGGIVVAVLYTKAQDTNNELISTIDQTTTDDKER